MGSAENRTGVIPESVSRYLETSGWGAVAEVRGVSGGDINEALRLRCQSGVELLLKLNRSAPDDMFEREADGLSALAVEGAPRVPKPYLWGREFLLLEYLPASARAADYWETFGRRLAILHARTAPRFGFEHDNYIGRTPQPNPWEEDGHRFFAEHRLGFQARLARERGLLSTVDVGRVERLAQRLPDLVPKQPASLIHGDLWSGNHIPGPDGHACLIDPAAHYGWAEADLAMTALFGRFPDSFYAAYESVRPLAPGYRSRFDLYNLYHLFNHLNLFGTGYSASVKTTLDLFD